LAAEALAAVAASVAAAVVSAGEARQADGEFNQALAETSLYR
jgi:hypothetical protein